MGAAHSTSPAAPGHVAADQTEWWITQVWPACQAENLDGSRSTGTPRPAWAPTGATGHATNVQSTRMECAPENERWSIGSSGRSYAARDAGGLGAGAGQSPRWVRIISITGGCSMKASSRAQPSGDYPHCSPALGTHKGSASYMCLMSRAHARFASEEDISLDSTRAVEIVLRTALTGLRQKDISQQGHTPCPISCARARLRQSRPLLLLLPQQIVSQNERIQSTAIEGADRIRRRTHYRLAV